MIMQINGPVAPPLPYLSTVPSSTTFPNIRSADTALHIPVVRRVLSSPSKDQNRPRGPSDPCIDSRQQSQSRYITNEHGYEHEYPEDYLPSFLRDQQSTNTRLAIKQMAEHRVLLEAKKSSVPLELSEEDDYAWYLKNPHRYVRRPRDRGARKQRRKMLLYGEMVEERDDQTNRSLFSAYLVRHYGGDLFWEEEAGSRRNSAQRASTSFSGDTSATQTYWNDVDASDGDDSTIFWIDEWNLNSSPTLGNGSIRHPKLSVVSSNDNPHSLRSELAGFPAIAAKSYTMQNASNDSKKRWFTNPHHQAEGKRGSFFRTNSTRMRAGSHRRFSFLRIFSS